MLSTFIETHEFTRRFKALGYDDKDLRRLELEILQNPEKWPVMQGCNGLRKMRFSRDNRGKSGGIRVCYLNLPDYGLIYLFTCYAKNEQDNLSRSQCNIIHEAISMLKKELRGNAGRF